MHIKIAALLLVVVFEDLALSCNYNYARSCDSYHTITQSRFILLNPDYINLECRRYEDLFSCLTAHLGDCDLGARLSWQPIHNQIHNLCTTLKTAYMATRNCWVNQQMGFSIHECNLELQRQYDFDRCGSMDRYVECLQESAGDLCGMQAREVITEMAMSYVSMIRDFLWCPVATKPKTTTTPTPTTSTKSSSLLDLLTWNERGSANTRSNATVPPPTASNLASRRTGTEQRKQIDSDEVSQLQYDVLMEQRKKLKAETIYYQLMNRKLRYELGNNRTNNSSN